jgi:hypothetical protein
MKNQILKFSLGCTVLSISLIGVAPAKADILTPVDEVQLIAKSLTSVHNISPAETPLGDDVLTPIEEGDAPRKA